MFKLLLLPVLISVLSALHASAADCSRGSADERFACLQQQTCPNASSDADLLACYRTISMTLLGQSKPTAPPVQWITATAPAAAVAPQSTPAPAISAPAAAADTATEQSTRTEDPNASFGLQDPPAFTRKKQVEPDEISAVIVKLQKQPRGDYLIALNNGQLWQENEPSRSILQEGQSVKIIKRLMNAYKLVPDKGRSTNVSRVPCYEGDTDNRCALLASAPDQP